MYNINIVWNMLNCMTFIFWMHLIVSIDVRLRWIILFIFITLPVSWLIVGTPLINDLESNTFKPWVWHQLYDHNFNIRFQFSPVQFSPSIMSDSLQPPESQHARPPCPSPTPGVHSDSRPSSRWCHPAISSSVVPFSSCPQSLPASESFPMSQLFASSGQSTGVSALASVLPKNTQDGSPLVWNGWISLQS